MGSEFGTRAGDLVFKVAVFTGWEPVAPVQGGCSDFRRPTLPARRRAMFAYTSANFAVKCRSASGSSTIFIPRSVCRLACSSSNTSST